MTTFDYPLWASVPASILLVVGGLVTVIGSIGLLRLPSFFMRMHGPSMGNTLGTGCVLIASMILSSALLGRPVMHEILITVFIVTVSPVTAMILMRAAIYRTRVNEERRRRQEQLAQGEGSRASDG
ncbi:MAG: cation:proton antiporter [Xanthomonadaceae bacterium]|nr:cation:proton antiporter [Xanthomonadaceae bacterium]